ncbi:angiopoietin-related protein 1-like [Littorina saxatilis]
MVPSAGMQHYDMKTACSNGGILMTGGTCVCPRGYIGENCDILMRDCDDGRVKGKIKKNGVYWIFPKLSAEPFLAYCRMVDRPRTYVMDRVNNDVNFTRMWKDYKQGFGNVDGDHWIGLDKLHILTNSEDYELRFRVRLRSNSNLFQFYDKIGVDDEAHNYRITFSKDVVPGSLGDCLSPANGANFSTMDRDNDNNIGVHCARRHQAGFWFAGQDCTLCNPTGRLLQPDNQRRRGIPEEVFWTESLGNTVPYKVSAYLVNTIK